MFHSVKHLSQALGQMKRGDFYAKPTPFWSKGSGFWTENVKIYVRRVSAISFLRTRAGMTTAPFCRHNPLTVRRMAF
jgi:hypothetical protein